MERITRIVKELGKRKNYVKINDLADAFNVTPRTIRNDLNELSLLLEKTDIKLEKNRSLGIRLSKYGMSDNEINNLLLTLHDNKDYYSYDERENIIIERLLISDQPVTLEELAEETMASRTSLHKNLAECEKKLLERGVVLKKTPHIGLTIEANENQWRNAAHAYIMSKSKSIDFQQLYLDLLNGKKNSALYISSNLIKTLCENVNVTYLVNFIKRYEKVNNTKFTDNSFVSVFFLVCIAIYRNNLGKTLESNNYSIINFFEKEKIELWINDSISFINNGIDNKLNEYELQSILVFMLAQKRVNNDANKNEDFILKDEIFINKCKQIVKSFIEKIDEYLNLRLSNDEKLFDNLLLHIIPTIYRLLFGIKMENPLRENIKESYPEVFAACKYAGEAIAKETNSSIDDDEIGYLALHVEASIEKAKEKNVNSFYNTLIVCPEGVGTSNILYYKLLNNIPNLIIDKICSVEEFNHINKDNIDMVISTIPINYYNQLNIIVVNPLLYEEDIIKIKQMIRKISIFKSCSSTDIMVDEILTIVAKYSAINDYTNLEKDIGDYFDSHYSKRKINKKSLNQFLDEKTIMLNQKCSSWEEAFEMIGETMVRHDYFNKRYIAKAIKAVEKYGPYMFIGNGIALMHAKDNDSIKKIGFGFLTLDKPTVLDFESKSYDISCVVCLSARDDLEHLQALGELVEIVSDKQKASMLLGINDKKEFIEYIASNIKNINLDEYTN